MQVLRKEAPLDHGDIHLNGANMKQMAWQNKKDVIIMPLLTARENLEFYLGV